MGRESVAEPTRAPSEGYESVTSTEGYWVEREKHEPARLAKAEESTRPYSEKESPSSSQSIVCSMPTPGLTVSQALEDVKPNEAGTNSSQDLSPRSKNSSMTSRKSYKLFRGLHYLSPTYPHFMSPTGESEGLYCKTKRGVETGLRRKHKEDEFEHLQQCHNALPSRATATLEGAASALSRLQLTGRTHQVSYSCEVDHTLSAESLGISRRIGLAPWHRKDSQGSTWSVTSSIREVLRGKTPAITPNPAMQYDGQKGKTYATVDITNSNDPTFLPSEACRVHTPPSSGHISNDRVRGLFLDLKPSTNHIGTNASASEQLSESSNARRHTARSLMDSKGDRDWWDVEEFAMVPLLQKRAEPPDFEMEIPEHLPTSPLCPMHPKHKSGGMGLCMYHGRMRS